MQPHKPSRALRWVYALVGIMTLIALQRASAVANTSASDLYREPLRPQVHFTPPAKWMNDPNGLVYLDGEYHLFYQHHPYSNKWGPMHWGHAVSRDLLHWANLPIALYPDKHGAIFSGSAVFDRDNTSGLGSAAHPPLVAIFAYHDHAIEKQGGIKVESQGIAYSLDRGRTWTKYAGNPVLKNPGLRDFRDPKVFWMSSIHEWIMTIAVKDHVSFYSSKDLRHWIHESDFGQGIGQHGGVWECPDLFEMKVDGEVASRYVLLVSLNPGAPNGGSGTQYFIGNFDGQHFHSDSQGANWLDWGTDNYAGVTWSGVPASRILWLGWMSNWNYAQELPTVQWRNAMTLPRELKLVRAGAGLALLADPARELKGLRKTSTPISAGGVEHTKALVSAAHFSAPFELVLDLKLNDANVVALVFKNAQQEATVFRINRAEHRYELDRAKSGLTDFNASFSKLQTALMPDTDRLKLHVFVDRSSLEIFINNGQSVFSDLVFPHVPYNSVDLQTDRNIEVVDGTVYDLSSIWEGAP